MSMDEASERGIVPAPTTSQPRARLFPNKLIDAILISLAEWAGAQKQAFIATVLCRRRHVQSKIGHLITSSSRWTRRTSTESLRPALQLYLEGGLINQPYSMRSSSARLRVPENIREENVISTLERELTDGELIQEEEERTEVHHPNVPGPDHCNKVHLFLNDG
ncbi:hypothetical protein BJ742DRAFT_771883 [Cladochytrium replicatum]|nr:hypothetical protein BJ742DRAFT_771883 [Cladochytrium replicatum]